ncbi:MAG: hypothetical protein QM538_05890, partial [Methylacidiphilales bacterium]|nr:hypothetical protein [Candidatus Methylacidiphilales bacterium]
VFNSTCQTSAVAGASGFNTSWCALSSSASQPITTLVANSAFGYSVALNSTYALIGAPGVATTRGDAFLYTVDGTNTFNRNCLTAANTGVAGFNSPWCKLSLSTTQPITSLASGSYFGHSVALSSAYALIGSPGASNTRGEVFLFNLNSPPSFTSGSCLSYGSVNTLTNWCSFSPKITSNGATLNLYQRTYFGVTTAISDSYALISAPYYGLRGEVYLISLDRINGKTVITPTQINDMLNLGNFMIQADVSIIVRSNVNTTKNVLQLKAPDIMLESGITMSLYSLSIEQPTLQPSILSYVSSNRIAVMNQLNLTQTHGSITLTSSYTFTAPSVNIYATATGHNNGDIRLQSYSISAQRLGLFASDSITSSSGVITSITSSSLTLVAGNEIGHTTAISISSSTDWTANTLMLSAGPTGHILLESNRAGLINATIDPSYSSVISLKQTVGSISLNANLNYPLATVSLFTSDPSQGNINLANYSIHTKNLSLIASGNITTTTGVITASNINLYAYGLIGIGTELNPITITNTTDWTFNTLTASTTNSNRNSNASIYLKSNRDGLIDATIGISTGTVSLEQTTGSIVLNQNLSFPLAKLILKTTEANGAILFGRVYGTALSLSAASITLSSGGIYVQGFPTAGNFHLRAGSLTLVTTEEGIGGINTKVVISSANGEEPDFSTLKIQVPSGKTAYLVRLGSDLAKVNSAADKIKTSAIPGSIINFYNSKDSTTPILIVSKTSALKKKADSYQGPLSQILYSLFSSIGLDCAKDDLLATISIKLVCSLGL